MIRVVLSRNYLEPADRSEYLAEPPPTGLLRDVLSSEAKQALAQGAVCYRNGQKLENPLAQPVTVGDFIHVVNEPGVAVPFAIQLAIAFVAAIVIRSLMPKLPKPPSRGDESSPTYAFGGIQSNRTDGEPKALVYGKMMVGGQIINEETTFSGTGKQNARYAAQISFGEGPVKSIAGITVDTGLSSPLRGAEVPATIFIDGTEAPTLGDVEADIRLGTNEQLEMATFRLTSSEVLEVGQELTQITTDQPVDTAPIIQEPGTPQATQDTTLAAFAISTDLNGPISDRLRLIINFPLGLYRFTGSGAAISGFARFFIRYQELTSGGTPITTGGNYGDGWVRLPHTISINASSTVPFSVQIEQPLFDPQTFVPVVGGKMLSLTASNSGVPNDAVTTGFSGPAVWVDGQPVQEMSVEVWFNPISRDVNDPDQPANVIGTTIILHEGLSRGFHLSFLKKTFHAAPGVTEDYWVPVFEANNKAATQVYELMGSGFNLQTGIPTARVSNSQWTHVAVTYKKDALNSNNRYRIYVNGELVHEVAIFSDLLYSTGNLHIGRDPSVANSMHGQVDEPRVYSRELTALEIADSYAGGSGKHSPTNPTGLVAAYHCDGNSNTAETDYSGFGNDLTLSNPAVSGANTFSDSFILGENANNTPKASNWRVEIMRNNRDSVDPNGADDADLSQVVGLIDERFSYPNEPILGIKVHASENLSGAIPQVTAVLEGRLVPVWDGGSATNPSFFPEYSANPAWVVADVLLDRRGGLGSRFSPKNIDAASFQEWADYCDEKVYDGKGDRREGFGVSGASDAYRDLFYDASVSGSPQFDGRGRIRLRFGASKQPTHWSVGEAVGWYGEHVPAGFIDHNAIQSGAGGYEIESMSLDSGGVFWNVDLYWDRLDEGDPWTDGTYLSASAGFPAGGYLGTVEGREVRFRYDGVIDKPESAWDTILQICGTARAICIVEGDRVRVRVQKPRSPVALVGQAQVLEGTFSVEWDGSTDRPNSFVVRYHDRDLNYERTEARYEDPSVALTSAASNVREGSVFARGITRRSQALRHAKYTVNLAQKLTVSGGFEVAPDGLFFEVGDVIVLAHDLMPWGDSGRILNASGPGDRVVLDRSITIEAATTHYVRVRNDATGLFETGEIDTTVHVPGTYVAGTIIQLTTTLSFIPQRSAPFVHYKDGDEFFAEVVDIELTSNMKVRVAWSVYDATVYDDDFGDQTLALTLESGGVGADQGIRPPANVSEVTVREGSVRGSDGTDQPQLLVGWSADSDTARGVASYAVWARVEDADPRLSGPWEALATAHGGALSATLAIPPGVERQSYAVAVQPISRSGAKLPPELCAKGRRHVLGLSRYPDPATSFSATRHGMDVVFAWTVPTAESGTVAEIRVGGWVLGQLVVASAPGVLEAVLPAASGGAGGTGDPTYQLRLRTPSGRYSTAMEAQVSDGALSTQLEVREDSSKFFSDQAWEDFGTGWTRVSVPTTTLTDLQVSADNELEFSSSALTGTFQTPNPLQNVGWKVEEYFIETFAVARQVHPTTWADMAFTWGEPVSQRTLWEGPLDLLPGETSPCALVIEIAWKETSAGSWSDWQVYRPGIYTGVIFRFRITVTRPDTTYDVRIERFSTRISRVPRKRWERNPHRSQLLREVMA